MRKISTWKKWLVQIQEWREGEKPQAPKPKTRHYRHNAQVPTSQPKGWTQILFQKTELNFFLALVYLVILCVIVFGHPQLFAQARWAAIADLNRDGIFTITDLFYWAFWLFYLPGDVVLTVLMQFNGPATFFELYADSYGGLGSLIMSSLYWWLTGGAGLLFAGLIPIILQTFLRN